MAVAIATVGTAYIASFLHLAGELSKDAIWMLPFVVALIGIVWNAFAPDFNED